MEFESFNFHENRTRNLVKCRDQFDSAVKLVNKLKACAESARRDDFKKQSKWFTLGKSSISKAASLTDLEQSLGTIKETEQIGYDILSGLRDDRDALLMARFHVIETDRSTSEAGEVLLLIGSRINVQVMLLILLISVLFVIIFLLIYCKLAKKKY